MSDNMVFRNAMDLRAMLPLNISPARTSGGRVPLSDRMPIMQKVSDPEVVAELRSLASGWSPAVQKALSLPRELFHRRQHTPIPYVIYSRDENSDILAVFRSVQFGGDISSLPKFAILVTEKWDSVNFLLVDKSRKIVVFSMLKSLQSPSEQEWTNVSNAITKAAALAQQSGQIALYNNGGVTLI